MSFRYKICPVLNFYFKIIMDSQKKSQKCTVCVQNCVLFTVFPRGNIFHVLKVQYQVQKIDVGTTQFSPVSPILQSLICVCLRSSM